MTVRTITPEEIRNFELIGVTDPTAPTLNLTKWIEDGRTELELCFVIEKEDQFLGRIIYGFFEDQPKDLKIWHFKVATAPESILEVGNLLLGHSVEQLAARDFNTIENHLYSTQGATFETYKKIFEMQGFTIEQEKKNFVAEQIKIEGLPKRLNFKTLDCVGEQVFIEAIEQVTKGTLDRDDQNCIQTYGAQEAAVNYFNLLKDIEHNPDWWRLAYNDEQAFVGLVVPQKFDEESGAINYIGVSPDMRGKGYVKDLLIEGANLMLDDGINEIIADIDVENIPLENALLDLGFEYTRSLIVLKKNLTNR